MSSLFLPLNGNIDHKSVGFVFVFVSIFAFACYTPYARLDNTIFFYINAWLLKQKIYHSELDSLNPAIDCSSLQIQPACMKQSVPFLYYRALNRYIYGAIKLMLMWSWAQWLSVYRADLMCFILIQAWCVFHIRYLIALDISSNWKLGTDGMFQQQLWCAVLKPLNEIILVTYASIVLLDQFQVAFNGCQIDNRKRCLDIVNIKATYQH